MSDKKIAQVSFGLPLQHTFDYSVPERFRLSIEVGCRVRVIFNHRPMVGYIYGFLKKTKIKRINPILELIDREPIFSKEYLSFLHQIALYYCASVGDLIETAIPELLREGQPLVTLNASRPKAKSKPKTQRSFKPYVYCVEDELRKEEFFNQRIKETIEQGRQVILLLPDNSLVEKWHKLLQLIFTGARIVILHSHQSKKETLSSWSKIHSQQADIVIGLRSAVFAPLEDIGLIIVDCEDNFVYKQETRPYYNARDVAIFLARRKNASLVLSSVAPSLEAFYATKKEKFKLIYPLKRPILPAIKLIDLKTQAGFKSKAIFPLALIERIKYFLEQKKKILIFLNRRGFATSARCRHCGYLVSCPRCSSKLTYYYHTKTLKCPHCNYQEPQERNCPKCNYPLIYFSGMGVERIESEAYRLFPQAKIACIESTQRRPEIAGSDIIITTQLALKEGVLQARLDMCAVVSIDNLLNTADFRACEQAFRTLVSLFLLTKEEMVIQTFIPEQRIFSHIRNLDYLKFAQEELKSRKALGLPPLEHLICVNLKGADQERLAHQAQEFYKLFCLALKKEKTKVFPPIEDIPFRLRSKFRLQILIKTSKVGEVNRRILQALSKARARSNVLITVNVDI